MENWKEAFVYIKTEEDEKKWKEILRHYFPNHYASSILDKGLVVSKSKKTRKVKRIGISVYGYGWLSATMLFLCPKEHFVHINDFNEFMTTDVYKEIVSRPFYDCL